MSATAPLIDLLCISPHPDDAEIGVGGTLRLLAERGRRVWVCDLTRGELGSNGSPEERWREAERASAVLGLTGRWQLALPDGFIAPHERGQVEAVAAVMRLLRPRWVVTAPAPLRHPDHLATPPLVQRAAFLARLAAFRSAVPERRALGEADALGDPDLPWRCEALLEVCPPSAQPNLIFDVSTTWNAKLAALACFETQFRAEPGRRATMINDARFLAEVERTAQRWGYAVGCSHGEALRTSAVPLLSDLPGERWT